ncbi:hypothetical protein [Streptomyces sp. NPDC001205]
MSSTEIPSGPQPFSLDERGMRPVEVHCHGFGDVDFSDFTRVDLDRLAPGPSATRSSRRTTCPTGRSTTSARWRAPVPGAIIKQAVAGRIAACINFDGEHVDLALATRAVQLMGPRNAMIMTDRCDSARLGGRALHHTGDNRLWYEENGVVAAGSHPLVAHIANARANGLSDSDISYLVARTAHRTFGIPAVEHATAAA